MANPFPIILLTLTLAMISMLVHSRPLHNTTTTNGSQTLAARLKLDQGGGSPGCWEALFELRACTGEILVFFLNGETFLGTGCCRAIVHIERQCWPSLMGTIGFTSQEGDILRGYCDVSDSSESPTSLPVSDSSESPTSLPSSETSNNITSNCTSIGGF